MIKRFLAITMLLIISQSILASQPKANLGDEQSHVANKTTQEQVIDAAKTGISAFSGFLFGVLNKHGLSRSVAQDDFLIALLNIFAAGTFAKYSADVVDHVAGSFNKKVFVAYSAVGFLQTIK